MICRGTRVKFELADGTVIAAPSSNGLLHDPTGREWPKNSMLVGPFSKGPRARDVPLHARQYLGRTHQVHEGSANIESLPRALGEWTKLGEIATARSGQGVVYYCRGGTKAPGCYHHRFNGSGLQTLVRGNGRVTLYRLGRWYRVQLPRGAHVDDRGLVWP